MGKLAKVNTLLLIFMGFLGCGGSTTENDERIINEAIGLAVGMPLTETDSVVDPQYYPRVKVLSIYPTGERPADKRVVNILLIGKLTEVEELNLGANNISDLSPLANLNKLTRLDFSLNKVADLKPLEGKKNLIILNAHGNQIEDISPLSGMAKLEVVYLGNNQISDITPLLQLGSLKQVTLKGNKVSAADIEKLKKALPEGCYFEHD